MTTTVFEQTTLLQRYFSFQVQHFILPSIHGCLVLTISKLEWRYNGLGSTRNQNVLGSTPSHSNNIGQGVDKHVPVYLCYQASVIWVMAKQQWCGVVGKTWQKVMAAYCHTYHWCEMKLFWNNFEIILVVYCTSETEIKLFQPLKLFQYYFSDIEHVGKYSWVAVSSWNNLEIISGQVSTHWNKIISVGRRRRLK